MIPTTYRKPRSNRRKRSTSLSSSKQAHSGVKKRPRIIGMLVALFLIVLGFLAAGALTYFIVLPSMLLKDVRSDRVVITATDPDASNNHVLVLLVDDDGSASSYWIEGTQLIQVPGGYGEYEARSLGPLLFLDNKNTYIRPSFTHALGALVRSVVLIDSWEDVEGVSAGAIETQSPNAQKVAVTTLFLNKALSHLNNPELFKQYLRMHYLLSKADFHSGGPLKRESLLSKMKSQHLIDRSVAESCTLAIVNRTDAGRFASSIAQLLEQSGGVVIKVGTESHEQEMTQLIIDNQVQETCKPVVELISGMFPQGLEVNYDQQDVASEYRAKIVLLLGKNSVVYSR